MGEQLLSLDPVGLVDAHPPLHGDGAHACLAEMREQAATQLREAKQLGAADRQRSLAHDALMQIVDSPWWSPLLWYEDIFVDLAQELARRKDRSCLEMQRRRLAHQLRFDPGTNTHNGLLDLAWFHVRLGEAEHGLRLYAEVVRDDPSDVWTYNDIAMGLGDNGCPELALKAAERGLALTRLKDENSLRSQFQDFAQECKDRRDEFCPPTAAVLQAALAMDVRSGRRLPPHELCRALVPDIDTVATKALEPMPDAESLARLRHDLGTLSTSRRWEQSSEKGAVPTSAPALRTEPSLARRAAP